MTVTLVPDSLYMSPGTDTWIKVQTAHNSTPYVYGGPRGFLFTPEWTNHGSDSIQVRVGASTRPGLYQIPISATAHEYFEGRDTLALGIFGADRFDIDLPLCPSGRMVWVAIQDGVAGEWQQVPFSEEGASLPVFQDRVAIAVVEESDTGSTLELSLAAADDLLRAAERLGDPCEDHEWVDRGFSAQVEVRADIVNPFVRPTIEVGLVRPRGMGGDFKIAPDIAAEFQQSPGRVVRIKTTSWYIRNPFVRPVTAPNREEPPDTFRVTLPDFSGLPDFDTDWALDPVAPIVWRVEVGGNFGSGTLTGP